MASSPVLVIVAVLVRARLGSPVLFAQERPGLHGEVFRLYKFRTMQDLRGLDGQVLPDRDRLTRLGRFLRATSLDELPELYNVLRGDMSLVGPRPLLVEYLDRYTPDQRRRHDVRPGLTGWAQVNGRNDLSWEEKFELDVWYVDNWTLRLDTIIVAKTVVNVLRARGINQSGHATVDHFAGTLPRDGTSTP